MVLRLLGVSYLLFGLVLIAILWGDPWLPRNVGIAIAGSIVVCWFVSAHFIFKYLGLPTRAKIVGWLSVIVFVGYSIARRFSSYYLYHSAWSLMLSWDAVGLLLIAIWLGFALLILRKASATPSATPYTVESEAPDHVLHVNGPYT